MQLGALSERRFVVGNVFMKLRRAMWKVTKRFFLSPHKQQQQTIFTSSARMRLLSGTEKTSVIENRHRTFCWCFHQCWFAFDDEIRKPKRHWDGFAILFRLSKTWSRHQRLHREDPKCAAPETDLAQEKTISWIHAHMSLLARKFPHNFHFSTRTSQRCAIPLSLSRLCYLFHFPRVYFALNELSRFSRLQML